MTYKITIYGKRIETEEYEDLQELINEVHFLLERKLGRGKINAIHVSVE